MRKILTRALVWLVTALVLLEVALQIGAYVVWLDRGANEVRSEGDGPVVLCVGDSMTYGLGSTAGGSYPNQLQRILRQRDGRSWVVINGGRPGRNTRGVITLLNEQLPKYSPDYVAILIGTNNQWASAESLATTGDGNSFPIVWRTGRLIDIMLAGPLGDREPGAFVGVWHRGEFETAFESDGRVVLPAGEVRWVERNGDLLIVMPDESEVPVEWWIDDGQLHLRCSIWNEEQILEPGASPDRSPLHSGQLAVARRDWKTAVDAFETVLAADADSIEAIEGLATAYFAQGDATRAERYLDQLDKRHHALPVTGDLAPCDARVAGAYAHALLAANRIEKAIQVATEIIKDHPDDARAWEILMPRAHEPGSSDTVLALIELAVTELPDGHELRSQLLFQRALIVRHKDPEDFVRTALEVRRAGATDETVVNLFRLGTGVVTGDVLERALRDVPPAEAEELRQLCARGRRADDELATVLDQHLAEILETCRAAGTRPLLLDYPFRSVEHQQTIARVASTTRTPHVRIRARFEQLLQTTPSDDLFIGDGVHCTDRGYGEMAKQVADVILALPR